MLINRANLDGLRVGFKTSFQGALSQAPSQWNRIATLVTSNKKKETYGWLGQVPNVKEWLDRRQIQNLTQHDYTITEKAFELTISVDRDDVETDNLGMYSPLFAEMGNSAMSHWDLMTFSLLKQGFTSECYDGQNFFDTDHPVIAEDGETVLTVSNTGGGSGTPWFLLATGRPLKPLILQRRKDFEFVAKDNLEDENVFWNKEFVYGTDARANVGFGFWQMAYGSKQTLDEDSYEAARVAISSMKGDHGRPMGLVPNLLVVPPALEGAAKAILQNERNDAGATNKWRNTAELLSVPWLA